jgi:hypothetical protein
MSATSMHELVTQDNVKALQEAFVRDPASVNERHLAATSNIRSAGGWRMGPLDNTKLLPARRARRAFLEALDKRDQDAAELAVASLVRSSATAELFDYFALHGARNFSGVLGHPAIFVSHAWRALQCIGQQHAVTGSIPVGSTKMF